MSFITPGIKYIKVSKFDSEGRDNTISLREITDLRLNTNDNGFINYPIVARTEYEDYFLLQTVTTNITSSTNNQILDYQVSASNVGPVSGSFDLLFPAFEIGTKVINFTETIDALNYFNPVSGNYILDNTPNIPLIYTASCNYVYDGPPGQNSLVYLNFVQGGSSLGRIQITSGSGLNGTMLISGSFTPVENQTYSLYIGTTGETMNFTNIDFKITQSQPPTAGIGSQVIIEPYLPVPFINSDYNAVINNAITSRPNDKFFDVDFSSNQITAVNRDSIISASRGIGFATPSTVPQSNYTTRRITSPRYIGKELTSAEFNKYTGPTTNFTSSLGLQTSSYSGDISYGKTSNVGNPATNFVFFEYLSGTSPEWGNSNEGKTFVNIKYIINENGNVIQPVNDVNGINLGIIQQTFNGKDNAIVLLDDNDAFGVNFSSLNGPHSIFKSGYRIDPIIYSQTTTTTFSPELIFVSSTGVTGSCISPNYWRTGSSANILEAVPFGLNNFVGQTQKDIDNSGFFPITNTFIPQQYDEIRFEGDENKTFLIINTELVPDPFVPSIEILTLTLDKNIPNGTDLRLFLLRRYTPDPSNIILNVTKAGGGTSTGILKPEFLSPEVESKLETIISDLKDKNII
jgi:hypothetical protein